MQENKKHTGPQKRVASIDGIVSGGRSLGQPAGRAYTPNRSRPTPSLGSLKGFGDGFHPNNISSRKLGEKSKETEELEALLEEPIVLDGLDGSKKGDKRAKRPRRRKIIKRAVLSLGCLLLIGGAYFGIKVFLTEKNLFRGGGSAPALAANIDINKLKGEGDGRINILVLGVGGPGHDGGDLTDTIMLASIDPVNNTTALLSIPRDLWVKIPGDGYQKLNAAYAYGKQQSKNKSSVAAQQAGLDLLDKTIAPVIGVPIHYHAVVDFAAFKQGVDAVGGVTFNVPERLYDPTIAWENKYNPVIAEPGMQTFNGPKALLYAKSRETSSDFARGQRQRLLFVALKDKVFSLGTFSNPVKVSQLLSSLGNNVYTDFSLNDMMRMYKIMGKIPSKDISSLDMVTAPHDFLTTGNMNGLSIVQPKAGLFEYDAMNNYIRNALRDGFIAKENAKIAIYNATSTAGLATKESATLKTYGYNVITIGNTPAPTNPATTKLVDLSNGANKYTKNYLQERLKTTATNTLPASLGVTPPVGTSFVIILGNDVANSTQN